MHLIILLGKITFLNSLLFSPSQPSIFLRGEGRNLEDDFCSLNRGSNEIETTSRVRNGLLNMYCFLTLDTSSWKVMNSLELVYYAY